MPLKSKKCLQNSDFDIADHFAISFKVSDSVKLASMNFMQERMRARLFAWGMDRGALSKWYLARCVSNITALARMTSI